MQTMTKLALAGALSFILSSCAGVGMLATAGGPVEAIVAKEVGYKSYFEQGLDLIASQLCANPRDPVTGDCT